MKANMEARKEDTPQSKERRARLREAIAFKQYEFDAHGVEMNHFYVSSAIVCRDSDERTLDVVGHGQFTLLTGIGGSAWRKAAEEIAASGFPIRCVKPRGGRGLRGSFRRLGVRASDCASALRSAVGSIVGTVTPIGHCELGIVNCELISPPTY